MDLKDIKVEISFPNSEGLKTQLKKFGDEKLYKPQTINKNIDETTLNFCNWINKKMEKSFNTADTEKLIPNAIEALANLIVARSKLDD